MNAPGKAKLTWKDNEFPSMPRGSAVRNASAERTSVFHFPFRGVGKWTALTTSSKITMQQKYYKYFVLPNYK